MRRALVMAGHGSHLNPDSSAAVRAHAARVEQRGAFDEVHTAFWKEEPSLARALDGCEAEDITVVPVFVSGGYFTEIVIPREMRLSGRVSNVDGRTVRYANPAGSHPSVAQVIVQRAIEAGAGAGDSVVVLGHGTPRHPGSAGNVYAQAAAVRTAGVFAEVGVAFIDQNPNLADVFDLVSGDSIVMVPLFIADGWHVTETIPGDIGIDGGRVQRDGRALRYAGAVGTHPAFADVVLELAEEAARW